jgi:predicted MFS family arabinose efflux permease
MVVGATTSLLIGTTMLARTGSWNVPSTVCLACVGVFVALAVASERRATHPIFPRPLWTRRGIGLLLLVAGMLYGGWMCANFYLGLVLQRSLEYSPTAAGAALSLFGISALPASRLAAWWLARGGGEIPMLTVGLVVQCASTAALALIEPGVPYLAFAPLLFLTMTGQTGAWIAVNNLVLRSAAPGHHGIAVGLLNGALQIGGGMGLGVVALTVGALLPAATTASTDAGYRVAFLVAASVIGLAVPLVGLLHWRVRRMDVPPGRGASSPGPQVASGTSAASGSALNAPSPPVPSVSSRADLDSGPE